MKEMGVDEKNIFQHIQKVCLNLFFSSTLISFIELIVL